MSDQPDTLDRGTIVRNIKSGKLAYVLGLRGWGDEPSDPVYSVESRRDGKRFGPVRYLKRSQIEVVN